MEKDLLAMTGTIEKEKERILRACDDCVSHPGKFEGEPIYSPYFYELSLNGMGELVGEGNEQAFELEALDFYLFSELEGVELILTWQDEAGFHYARPTTRAQLDELEAQEG